MSRLDQLLLRGGVLWLDRLARGEGATYLRANPKRENTMRLPAALAALAFAILASAPAQAIELAAHRALYQLTLSSSRGDVAAANGTIAYEALDACDGWAVRQRLQMSLTNRDGQDIEMISDYVTWESKDGLSFRFRMKQTTESAVTSQTEGEAKLDRPGGRGEAHYTVPRDMVQKLPEGTLFPMAHTVAILDAAQAGKKFVTIPLFDGMADTGAQDSAVAILGWNTPERSDFPGLSDVPFTRVHIAFFDRESGASTPDLEVGMKYWANGVDDDLQMDFGEFVIAGKMTEFSPQPHRC
jgi:EipB-like